MNETARTARSIFAAARKDGVALITPDEAFELSRTLTRQGQSEFDAGWAVRLPNGMTLYPSAPDWSARVTNGKWPHD